MAVSIAQYVDLLFKKLQGVAKTANATVKGASNESIASPAFLRGDIVWMQSDQIPSTAQAVSNISNARINGNSVQCVADTTVPPIGGIYPTWLSNVSYWIPQELGATWLPKVFVGPSGAANIQSTGTQIFAAGISGVGEYYFDTQAGVLNFIGETIPSVLTAGNVVYISGYEYVGAIGVTNQPGNLTVGNLSITSTTANRVLYTNNDNFVVTNNNLTFDGSSLVLTGTANISANVSVGNLYSAGLIDAVGNVNGNNFNVTNALSVTGNAIIGGDLVVNGNLTYVNVADLNVEDPIIGLGRGANDAPLTTNDGKDRGEQLWYYSGSEKSAFIGYDNSAGNLLAAVDVTIANEIVTVNQFGTWQIGNLYGESALIIGNVDAANISSTGNISAIGNVMAGNVISSGAVIGNVEISGNLTVLNLTVIDYFQGNIVNISNTISAMGTITGGNLVSNAAISAATTIDATGNITGGNLVSNAAITAATTVDAIGNITGGNLTTAGLISATGNITGGNITTNGIANIGTLEVTGTGSITGNANVGNLSTAGQIVAIGNITGGNISAGSGTISTTGNIDGANVNATAGITAGTTVIATGNITGGNVNSNATFTGVTANISGNVNAGNVNIATALNVPNVTVSGNVLAGNVNSNAAVTGVTITASGNLVGSNANITNGVYSATVDATGNITAGNLITTGDTKTGTLETTGNALIGGNLIVQGNITYINIDDLRVEDPIIILGTGPNGAPLIVDDGKDRGIYMEYFETGLGNAFVGFKNSSGNMVIANDVYFTANDVVGINSYGTLEAGNLYIQSAVSTGNVAGGNFVTAGQVTATGNITGGNLNTGGTINATGNVNGTGAVFSGNVTAQNFIGNVDAGGANTNIQFNDGDILAGSAAFTFDKTSNAVVATGNVTGANLISNAGIYGNTANITGNLFAGNVYSGGVIDAVGNITGSNLITAGLITAVGNITGGNLITIGTANIATLEVTGTANVALTATVGNLSTLGVVSATGNVTGGNINTAGNVSATGNINGGNINTAGNVTANYVIAESGIIGNITIDDLNVGNITANGFANITGNVTGGNLITAGLITATGNVIGGNLITAGLVNATGNVTGGNLITAGLITVVGNIIGSGAVFSGNVTSDTFIGNIVSNTGTVGNLTFANTTISTQLTNGNITLATTGNSFVQIGGTYGLVVPAGNTAQRLAVGNVAGTVRFNTDVSRIEVYDGTEWDQIVSGVTSQTLNGDGSTVAFTLDRASTSAAALIMLNGVVQRPGSAYNITPSPSTNLIFTEAPAVSDTIDIRYL
jgi:hypothetical protein